MIRRKLSQPVSVKAAKTPAHDGQRMIMAFNQVKEARSKCIGEFGRRPVPAQIPAVDSMALCDESAANTYRRAIARGKARQHQHTNPLDHCFRVGQMVGGTPRSRRTEKAAPL